MKEYSWITTRSLSSERRKWCEHSGQRSLPRDYRYLPSPCPFSKGCKWCQYSRKREITEYSSIKGDLLKSVRGGSCPNCGHTCKTINFLWSWKRCPKGCKWRKFPEKSSHLTGYKRLQSWYHSTRCKCREYSNTRTHLKHQKSFL